MSRQEIIDKLKAHKEELRRLGVASLAVFGSAARDETVPGSDIDLLIEFDRAVGVFHFFTVKHRLEEILGVSEIDMVQRGALHPALRDLILAEAVNVD
ncbi:MAG: nucleotidyltransferase family protein [Desulfobacterales bacterium]|uniref:Nucleotidyltransferase family protein n=1 Tax=Candidatus Desulfatibia vada TaxID=2841696 RepID=A0A8J6TKH5_9BACT|nr:nucleotidyltransferase family protein [Candidatus Desulfatibia vada]